MASRFNCWVLFGICLPGTFVGLWFTLSMLLWACVFGDYSNQPYELYAAGLAMIATLLVGVLLRMWVYQRRLIPLALLSAVSVAILAANATTLLNKWNYEIAPWLR